MEKTCPLLMLAASIDGLKPMLRNDISKCTQERCAWWQGEQCAMLRDNPAARALASKPLLDRVQPSDEITDLLFKLGLPPHLKGFDYIREAVKILSDKGCYIGITTQLYPAIAERRNTAPGRVERAIRHAIGLAIDNNRDQIVAYFPQWTKRMPSNGEFLRAVVEKFALGKVS